MLKDRRGFMPLRVLPRSLVSSEVLEDMIALLLEKEALRRLLKTRNFGDSVVDADEARRLFNSVSLITREVLDISATDQPDPEIVLTHRLSQLPRKTFKLCLLSVPVSLFLLYCTLQQPDGGGAIWVVRAFILFLLFFPFIIHRRLRLNIEHECGYVKNTEGKATIIIDQLPAIQFQSYVSHEYAHHLFFQHLDQKSDRWIREGWARLVQWQVAGRLYRLKGNPAYLYHVLIQIVGELKFACQIISMALHRRLPLKVRWIRTVYHANPLFRFFTGTPGFNMTSLVDHAVGTAFYFLMEQRKGLKETLWGSTL